MSLRFFCFFAAVLSLFALTPGQVSAGSDVIDQAELDKLLPELEDKAKANAETSVADLVNDEQERKLITEPGTKLIGLPALIGSQETSVLIEGRYRVTIKSINEEFTANQRLDWLKNLKPKEFAKLVPPPVTPLIALLIFGIALLLFLILRFKLQAFLALLVASAAVAAGATIVNPDAISLTQIGGTITKGMGSALGFIATIIGIGAIFGAILEHSGGTQALANNLVKRFGKERAPWAMLLTGFIISVPVFLDVALVILAPLLYALARDTGKPLLTFGLPLVVGMAVTHAFVPPTPGPVAVAYFLNVSLGWVILFGIIVGLPTALLLGPPVCNIFAKRIKVELPEPDDLPEPDSSELKLPSFGFILLLIGLPIALILCNSIVEQVLTSDIPAGLSKAARETAVASAMSGASLPYQLILFIGHPVIALLLTTLIALYFLGTRRGVGKEQLVEIATKSLGPAGIIILITGAGGVFKGVLGATGIADALEIAFGNSGIPILVLAWIFATLVRVAQGSATVAMITAAGLMAGFCGDLSQPMLALVVVCIAAGATGFSHVNDSGFWMISRYMRMTEAQTLRSWTILSTAVSFVGFAIALLVSLFVS